jgi:hypothetical protein
MFKFPACFVQVEACQLHFSEFLVSQPQDSMDQQKRVRILPNGKLRGGRKLIILEDDSLESFLAEASKQLWSNTKTGTRVFFQDGDEVCNTLNAIREGDTLYISEGEDWIGIKLFCCFPLPY